MTRLPHVLRGFSRNGALRHDAYARRMSRRKPLDIGTASSQLRQLLQEQTYVRVLRTPEFSDDLDGFVVRVGTKWALLQTTRDGGYFDGWNAFRIADVYRLRAQSESFQRVVSERQAAWPPTSPATIDLARTTDLLRGLSDEPLIGIEKERRRSAVWIGRVDSIEAGRLRLLEIDPQAHWDELAHSHALGAISRVHLRTEYLQGLASVSAPRSLQPDSSANR